MKWKAENVPNLQIKNINNEGIPPVSWLKCPKKDARFICVY